MKHVVLLLTVCALVGIGCDQQDPLVSDDLAATNAPSLGKKGVPEGLVYNEANRNYYQAIPAEGMTWAEARAAAAAMSYGQCMGHLATLTSAQENAFVTAAFPDAVANGYWLGGMQDPEGVEPAGGWMWVTGETWFFTNWNGESGEPNDFGDEDVLHFAPVFWLGGDGEWNDLNENFVGGALGYVVEYECPTKVTGGGSIVREDIEGSPREMYGFNAQKNADASVKGQAEVHFPNNDLKFHVDVSCLSVLGNEAWVGGTITRSDNPLYPVDTEVIWRLVDNGQGRDAAPDRVSDFYIFDGAAQFCATHPQNIATFAWDNGNVVIH